MADDLLHRGENIGRGPDPGNPATPSPARDPGPLAALREALYAPRVLEPEVMDSEDEAEAYADAAAAAHLARLDGRWIARVLATGPRGPAAVLDVGTGGGHIPAALVEARPEWRAWGVDRAWSMLVEGRPRREAGAAAARRAGRPWRLAVAVAEARRLPAADGAFDLVVSNSLLHHLADPTPVLDEVARLTAPTGRAILRDLRRPPRPLFRAHVAWHGRHYAGTMRRLYEASVAAAFTRRELAALVARSRLAGSEVRAEGAYLVVERRPDSGLVLAS